MFFAAGRSREFARRSKPTNEEAVVKLPARKGRLGTLMSEVYRIDDYRRAPRKAFFDRNELNQLLSLYSTRVASGEWRDYAIDQSEGRVIFSIFRHTNDRPLFSIAKQRTVKGWEFRVIKGRERLSTAYSLRKALRIFEKNLRLVT